MQKGKISMTDEQLNKRIHEIMGICCHFIDFHILDRYFYCLHCLEEQPETKGMANIDFINTWEGFGILWEFMQKHKDRTRFCVANGWHIPRMELNSGWCLPVTLINPPAFAKAVMEFFEEK